MPKICTVMAAAADLVIWTRDHCDPHVHAIAHNWEIRVFFSYAENDPCHLAVEILAGSPPLARIHDVVDEVEARLIQCRRRWWEIHRSTCLVHQNVTISQQGVLTWVAPPAGTKIDVASYSPAHKSVSFIGRGSATPLIADCP